MCALTQQVCHKLYCDGGTNIVCIRLECEPPDCNPLFAQYPQGFPDCLQKTLFLSIVDALHFFEQIERPTKPFADGIERSYVFHKTRTCISISSSQQRT